ncbi:hypothetical protein NMD1_00830 [Novosphingobium sp. MD-1]|nr:hypothetical protein NMD1_00830 [Novosphingobium sp. MD-1]
MAIIANLKGSLTKMPTFARHIGMVEQTNASVNQTKRHDAQ